MQIPTVLQKQIKMLSQLIETKFAHIDSNAHSFVEFEWLAVLNIERSTLLWWKYFLNVFLE